MMTLNNWYLIENIFGDVFAKGIVHGHPILHDGDFIHTSIVEKVYKNSEDGFILETHSGSLYCVKMDEMFEECKKPTQEFMSKFNVIEGDTSLQERLTKAEIKNDEIRKQRETTLEGVMEWVKCNLEPGQMHLVIEGVSTISAVYKSEEELVKIEPCVHVGMFQDSILLRCPGGEADFRYFPTSTITPYQWSGKLDSVIIYNLNNYNLTVCMPEKRIVCEPYKTITLLATDYKTEG